MLCIRCLDQAIRSGEAGLRGQGRPPLCFLTESTMNALGPLSCAAFALGVAVAGCGAQNSSDLVISSDPALGELAAALLPDLAATAGMELKGPVRLEMRTREELVRYLRNKLDEELPVEEARARVDAYAFLGLVSPDLDLRAVLLSLYTEQVAGFYEPDSTALFVMDDQPAQALQALLVHELVHAVQDQSADLDALTDPALGNDRATAAQSAIEGHATLVMLEYMTEQMTGVPIDLGDIPDFASQLRPALEGMAGQFPALERAPRVIREGLLFPYLEGAGYVQRLWTTGERIAPFGAALPESTEQVLRAAAAPPVELAMTVHGATVVHEDVLGRFELGILLEDVLGRSTGSLADAWEGDRYILVESSDGVRGLVAHIVWETPQARDAFVEEAQRESARFGGETRVRPTEIGGRPVSVLEIGGLVGVSVSARVLPEA